jgi:hypothetical protein
MKNKSSWGGARPGAGRPRGRLAVTKSISLNPFLWRTVDNLRGGMTRSRFIALLIEQKRLEVVKKWSHKREFSRE